MRQTRRHIEAAGGGGFSGPPFEDDHSIILDGSSEVVLVDHHADFDFEYDTPFSVSCWAKSTNWGSKGMVAKMNYASPRGWSLGFATGQFYFFLVNSYTSTTTGAYVAGYVNDGAWRNFIVTYDGSSVYTGMAMYTNGSAGTLSNYPANSLGSNTIKTSDQIHIGSWWGSSTHYGWNGNLNDVAIWDKELSAAEAAEIYNSGDPADLMTHSAASNLVGYWTFDDPADDATHSSGTIVDRTGNGHDATPHNTEAADIEEDVP